MLVRVTFIFYFPVNFPEEYFWWNMSKVLIICSFYDNFYSPIFLLLIACSSFRLIITYNNSESRTCYNVMLHIKLFILSAVFVRCFMNIHWCQKWYHAKIWKMISLWMPEYGSNSWKVQKHLNALEWIKCIFIFTGHYPKFYFMYISEDDLWLLEYVTVTRVAFTSN